LCAVLSSSDTAEETVGELMIPNGVYVHRWVFTDPPNKGHAQVISTRFMGSILIFISYLLHNRNLNDLYFSSGCGGAHL
jgi:hypothetical protein